MSTLKGLVATLCGLALMAGAAIAQDYERINGAVIYDYDPDTKLGDDTYGTIVCDFEHDNPGRNSHGGPVAMEYANGDLVAFHTNTTGHNLEGWSEYAVSKDGGKTWDMYNKFDYSYEAYEEDPEHPVWVEQGLVTSEGTVVLVITHFELSGSRIKSGIMRSHDHGATWTDYEPIDGDFSGYPAAVAVDGDTNYVLFDSGRHVLYVSTDDGRTWSRRSTLSLDAGKGYGALCVTDEGRLLAGAYDADDEHHFYYCISDDKGETWTEQRRAHVDKKVRDPELAYLAGTYYLHGRSGSYGEGRRRFVLYQSKDGEHWDEGIIVNGREAPGNYSDNCIINKYNDGVPNELMVEYSKAYQDSDTNTYVFFVRPESGNGEAE